jgi:hypothetical protein
MRRTPYSPFVEKAMAPLPWYAGRGAGRLAVAVGIVGTDWVVAVSGGSSISE